MQKYKASIKIMPLKELLDPQGKTVSKSMKNLEIDTVEDVRIGKYIEMYLSAISRVEAEKMVDRACKKLLANLIMENYEFELTEI
ncbi:MAG: phosphoribosylformylglycinamidine synthase subunit PurS [Saprospirales bacterium]|nr:MAG: phosphoribosylformylglycinamidine synthase subunit PurS [Saprospirales bacterium]